MLAPPLKCEWISTYGYAKLLSTENDYYHSPSPGEKIPVCAVDLRRRVRVGHTGPGEKFKSRSLTCRYSRRNKTRRTTKIIGYLFTRAF